MNKSVIAFYSAENFFKQKTVEKQREKFDALASDFEAEFGEAATEETFASLLAYQEEMRREKRIAEEKRIAKREAVKALEASKPLAAGMNTAFDCVTRFPAGKYVLTVAQNNTYVDQIALDSLLNFCKVNDAKLLVAKTFYNKNGFAKQEDDWFDPKIVPFLVEGTIDLDGKAHFAADANIMVTAKNPASGFKGLTPAGVDVILPASKISLSVAAALKNAPTKRIVSTGAITKRNYIMRKAGAVAAIEHNIGACFYDNGELRNLEIMAGANGFYDDLHFYGIGDHVEHAQISALQFGDIHCEKMLGSQARLAYDLVNRFEPEHVILHDVLDFASRNHHNLKDPLFMVDNASNLVYDDINTLAGFLANLECAASGKVHIVESNHDLALTRWVKDVDWKTDPINAHAYLTYALACVENRGNSEFNLLQFAVDKHEKLTNTIFHKTDESVMIAGIEMGNHGHNGVNGSRGSPTQFRELGVPMNTGHTHAPSISGACYTAGVWGSLEMGYNIGASSWAYANIVTYPNGQRQIRFY
jgi:hypothetical protein